MPRAASSTPALRRNQACRPCRKKKLKCDAKRPFCGQCVKHWQGITSVPAPEGYAHVGKLEDQIAELKRKLEEAGIANSPPTSELSNDSHISDRRLSSLAPPSYNMAASPDPPAPRSDISLPRAGLNVVDTLRTGSPRTSNTSSPDLTMTSTESLLSLFAFGWNPDLPDPAEMRYLIDVFFACDPCGSRILHKPSFMASMDFSPKDPRFPHSAILHAICTSASRWTARKSFMTPDGIRRDTFAEYHAGKTRQYIDRTMASGADIFSVLQACIILSWYFYAEGRWVEVWIFAGFQTRVAVPLRLNHKGTFSSSGTGSPGAYLPPPRDAQELEMRRRTWWMSVVLDRVVSVGGWLHGVEYKHIATELPLRRDDFENNQPLSNPQDLHSDNFYTNHYPQFTDSFLLFIKAVMLFGQVTDFNTELNLKTRFVANVAPHNDPSFRLLDRLVAKDFLGRLPPEYSGNSYIKINCIDTDLLMVHLIPHAASITLHSPFLDFNDPQSLSTNRCIHAADAILDVYYTLNKAALSLPTSDFPHLLKLHPFVTICWYLAAVVKVQMCKFMIDRNEIAEEIRIWGEINAMRHAMLDYGTISPIGTRQEKLLQTLMSEIVRSTSQAQPLDIPVNFRLYPHSSKSAFLQDTSGAPLPTGPDAFGPSEASLGLTPIHSHMQPQGAWLQQGHSEIPLPQVHSHSQSPPSQSSSGHYMP
ncbi:hypothetical protein PNOK_0232400 [Pyrrhoderma noxium]|uniref:Zn(2)-C6 fungal-type domain-containing protein n=1 Tax=Pyrrhoderma noxium TaxID=2282107 RepID=A0A286US22_9AGAM|nr:hypothetical protein PNOK_0232400 [Pyrrhoderma noxium]